MISIPVSTQVTLSPANAQVAGPSSIRNAGNRQSDVQNHEKTEKHTKKNNKCMTFSDLHLTVASSP